MRGSMRQVARVAGVGVRPALPWPSPPRSPGRVAGPQRSAVLTRVKVLADQTITSAGQLVIAHGLGIRPRQIIAELVCQSNELGYTTTNPDVVPINPNIASSNTDSGISILYDATNVTIRYGAAAAAIVLVRADNGVEAAITNGNWKLRLTVLG